MTFSIVTPTLNRSPRLAGCLASVADQAGGSAGDPLAVEHLVMAKAGATERGSPAPEPRTVPAGDPASYRRRWREEPDRGMYDALNRGFAEATGDVFGWLNDDEQYLPGALESVRAWFADHPAGDVVFGDCLFVGEDGAPLSYRPALPMRHLFVEAAFLYNFSCALFFRAAWWRRMGGFDTTLTVLGDEELLLRALSAGTRCGLLNRPLAAFTFHPDRLSVSDAALAEHLRLKARVPRRRRLFQAPINVLRLSEKVLRGATRSRRNVEYAIFTPGRTDRRTTFRAARLATGWPARARLYFGARDFWKG
jgi:glycosyltransferase involved in cell wall biosynthesis